MGFQRNVFVITGKWYDIETKEKVIKQTNSKKWGCEKK